MIPALRTFFLLAVIAAPSIFGQAITASPGTVVFTVAAGSATVSSQALNLTNPGAATAYTATASQSWLGVTPASGSLDAGGSASLTITVDPATREAGAHSGTVTITAPDRPNSVITVNVTSQGGIITLGTQTYSFSLTAAQTSSRDFSVNFTGGATQLSMSSNASWLVVSSTPLTAFPATVNAQINPSTLTPGNYTGVITITSTGALSAVPKSLTFAMTVLAPATNMTVSTSPSPTYTDTAGSSTKKTSTVTVSNTGPSVIYAIDKAQPWITFSDPAGTTAKVNGTLPENGVDSFNIIVDPAGLTTGTYSETVTVRANNRPTRTILVTLVINPAPDLTVAPSALAFLATAGSGTQTAPQAVTVLAAGAGVNYSIARSQTWVVLSKTTGSVGTNASDTFAVAANPAGLVASATPYAASVTITATGRPTRIIPVTLSLDGGAILPTPTLFNVTAAKGAAVQQTLSVNFSPAGAGTQVKVEANSAGGWLSASKALFTTFPDTLTITVDAASLALGAHVGAIELVTPPGSPKPAAPVVINVFVNVVPPTGVSASPAAVSFQAALGASQSEPSSQTITITNQGPAVAYTVAASAPWIVPGKAGGTLAGGGQDSLTVGVNAHTLEAGVSSGAVTIQPVGQAPITIGVSLTVRPPDTGGSAPLLTFFPSRLQFFSEPGQLPPAQLFTVLVRNQTQPQLGVSATSGGAWLQLGAANLVAPGSVPVTVVQNLAALPASGEIQLIPASSSVPSERIPATLRAAGPAAYSIPRVADGDYFTTTITLVNMDTAPALVTLRFYKAGVEGTTLSWSPLMEGGAPLENVQIPAGLSRTWRTLGAGATGDAGWVRVLSEQRLGGFAVLRQTPPGKESREASVPLVTGWQQRYLLPFENREPYSMALALTNADPLEPALVEAVFRDDTGNLLPDTWSRTLPPMGHAAFLLPAEVPSLAARRGTAEFFTSGGRMAAVSLRFSGDPFTTIEAQSLNSAATGRYTIPQVADGDGFTTSITAVNNDTVTASVRLKFWRRTGIGAGTGDWNPQLEGNPPATVLIRPGASYTWRTRGAAIGSQGWAELISNQRLSGLAVFRQSVAGRVDQEAAVPVNVGPMAHFLLPFDNTEFVTSMALANTGGESATLDVRFSDELGRVLRTETITLPPRGHDAFALTRYQKLKNQRGTAEFRVRAGQVSALGLRFSGDAFTSFRPQVF